MRKLLCPLLSFVVVASCDGAAALHEPADGRGWSVDDESVGDLGAGPDAGDPVDSGPGGDGGDAAAGDVDAGGTDPVDADSGPSDALDAHDAGEDAGDSSADPPDSGDVAQDGGEDVRDAREDTPDGGGAPAWVRPSNRTCLATDRPDGRTGVVTARRFEGVVFVNPVALLQAPSGPDDWYVVERPGRVMRYPNRDDVSSGELSTFVDLRSIVDSRESETGLLGVAFDPAWPERPYVFLSFTTYSGGRYRSRVSRFEAAADRASLSVETELVVLEFEQPAWNHNGGDVAFGPDGMLYLSFGDGGGAGDPFGHGQNPNTFYGTILRLDVSGTRPGAPYAVPDDNPFVAGGGAPEVWAYGLRNPWRISFGSTVDELWVGDVGQSRWEEIDLVRRGGNYGWPVYEGSSCYASNPLCGVLSAEPPVVEYTRSEGISVTGGVVYRGSSLGWLRDRYVFGDFGTGTVWAVVPDGSGWTRAEVVRSGLMISAFGRDRAGEVYALDYIRGGVHQLVAADAPAAGPPARLSETGCVDPAAPATPASGVIAYGLRAPFWSDGAAKERWFALPDGEVASVGADGRVELPVGSVVVKQFRLGGAPVETRLLMRHDDGGWAGYTYRWSDSGDDAFLLDEGELRPVGGRSWVYPSRAECLECHTGAAGRTLGLEVDQLSGVAGFPVSGVVDQLDALVRGGVVAGAIGAVTPLSDPYAEGASVDARARSWLHTNCAMCHRPDGPGRGSLDLRWRVPSSGMCDALALNDLGTVGARVVAGSDADASVLVRRVGSRETGVQMPPVGSLVVDADGLAVLRAWISAGSCR